MTNTTDAAETAAVSKRNTVATKMYVLADGARSRHASPDVTGLEFAFKGGGTHLVNARALPENIQIGSMWHGVAQKLGDAYSGAMKKDQDPEEMFLSMLERLQNGEWVREGEGAGPQPSLIVQAIANLLAKKRGVDVATIDQKAIASKLPDAATRKATLDNDAEIKLEYDRLRLERQQAAFAKAQVAAEAQRAAGGSGMLDGFDAA